MKRDYADKLIGAASVVSNLKAHTIVGILPATESQARPLAALTPPEQVQAWQAVIEVAGDNKITAAQVQASAARFFFKKWAFLCMLPFCRP